jgi:hypothetical protein
MGGFMSYTGGDKTAMTPIKVSYLRGTRGRAYLDVGYASRFLAVDQRSGKFG